MSTAISRPPLHIGRVIQNAAAFNFRRLNGGAVDPDSIVSTVDELFALLHKRGVEYVLVGGIVMLRYVEGRNTEASTSSWHCLPSRRCLKSKFPTRMSISQGANIVNCRLASC